MQSPRERQQSVSALAGANKERLWHVQRVLSEKLDDMADRRVN